MIFHTDDLEIQTYLFNSESSTFTSGIMYQISETELTDYLPQRTAHPGMATMVLLKKQIVTRLPYPYGDCMETTGYNRGDKSFHMFGLSLERPYLMTCLYSWLIKSKDSLGNSQNSKSKSTDFKIESVDF